MNIKLEISCGHMWLVCGKVIYYIEKLAVYQSVPLSCVSVSLCVAVCMWLLHVEMATCEVEMCGDYLAHLDPKQVVPCVHHVIQYMREANDTRTPVPHTKHMSR